VTWQKIDKLREERVPTVDLYGKIMMSEDVRQRMEGLMVYRCPSGKSTHLQVMSTVLSTV
jgi:hypothetical protein